MRFPDKPRHQSFVEPMGLDTEEMYLQGLSSSLPEDVQLALYRYHRRALSGYEIMRNAYAIEYDCVDPARPAGLPSRFKTVPGLYGAGQFNGTSGYEEAAAQGLDCRHQRRAQAPGHANPSSSTALLPTSGH